MQKHTDVTTFFGARVTHRARLYFFCYLETLGTGSLRLLRRFQRITLNQTLEQICGKSGEVHHLMFIFVFFLLLQLKESFQRAADLHRTHGECFRVNVLAVLADYKHDFPASTL